ncbi:leucine-rich repeat domain-containing protein [Bacteroidota bacterium]
MYELNLSDNQLSGSIPTEIGDIPNLQYLRLSNNELTGSIPPEIANPPNLYNIYLNDNQLTGSIPVEIGNITNLSNLYLYNNQLSDSVPSSIVNCTNLYRLYIYNNEIVDLPDLSSLTNLDRLLVYENRLTFEDIELNVGAANTEFNYSPQKGVGEEIDTTIIIGSPITISVDAGGSDNLYQWTHDGTDLGISENSFNINPSDFSHTGTYVSTITSNIITDLTLYSSPINLTVDPLPHIKDSLALVEIYNSTNGSGWTDNTNWLTGPVSTWYGVVVTGDRVTEINLGHNNLAGILPPEIGDFTELTSLDIPGSGLISGPIPVEIGNLLSLVHLNFTQNQLTGSIPAQIGNLTNLAGLYLSDNQLTGSIPAVIVNLGSLTDLELNDNHLIDLPDLSTLSLLNNLYIEGNKFTFKDIEPNFSGPNTTFSYIPQDSVGNVVDTILVLGSTATLSFSDGGTSSEFQWKKDGTNVGTKSADSTYTIDPVDYADAGAYTVEITNTVVTDLTLYSLPINVEVDIYTYSDRDSLALVALYDSTDGPNWNNNSGWLTGSVNTWYGVTIIDDRVNEINLSSNNLVGIIPVEIGKFTELTYLNLYNNQLSDTLPAAIGNLASITYLNIGNNQLSGPIPMQIGNLTNLRELYLYNNQLNDTIPAEIGNLVNLINLNLDGNQLSGVIPPEIGNLVNLDELWISWNWNMSGPIPPEIGNLTGLINLSLSGNGHTGSIPPEIGNLSNLDYLRLSDNQLTGSIPPEIGNLTNLYNLYLSWNQLSGSIPSDIGKLSNLYRMEIGWNQLSGSIPPEIGNLSNLNRLYLNNNQLTGIPPEIGNLTNLNRLYLYTNQFSGSIPPELGNLTNLGYLDIGSNQFTGSIPTELSNLTNLYGLYLYNNQLSGSIPPEIGGITNLNNLDLNNNQLTGSIPPEIGNLANLSSLYLYNNQLTGSFPVEIGNLTNLYRVYLYDNQLTDSVPSSIGNCTNLRYLYIYNNEFTDIPDLSPLIGQLDYLYIENNKFQFDDIELNVGVPGVTYRYSPQKNIGAEIDTTIIVGSPITIAVEVGGSDNVYQWTQDGTDIGITTNSFTLDPSDFTHTGTYVSTITSNVITDLTLYSSPFNLVVDPEPHIKDSLALVEIYNSTNGTGWTDNTNWLAGPVPTWYGISVTGDRVTEILLGNNNLDGTLPPEIGDFTELATLDLPGSGLISGSIPEEIGNLLNLAHLNISKNQLTGSIPPQIGNLTNLAGLYLDENQLTGSIPLTLGTLTNLQDLQLNDNDFDGLPDLSAMTLLNNLWIENNKFTFKDIEPNVGVASTTFSYIPQDTVGNVVDTILVLGSNATLSFYDGGASSEFQWKKDSVNIGTKSADSTYTISPVDYADAGAYTVEITNTVVTDLTLYSLPINVEVDIYTYSDRDSLALVALYDSTDGPNWNNNANWKTGPVSTWWGINVTNNRVTEINLDNNNLVGIIPVEIGDLTDLKTLRLMNNQLADTIPTEIGNLTNLEFLNLGGNNLYGPILEEIVKLTKLTELHLWNNQLTDTIPAEIGDLVDLAYMNLDGNQFTGGLPPEIGNLTNLIELRFSWSDPLGGPIPPEIGNLTNLERLILQGNEHTGSIPAEIGNLTNLIELGLCCNQLSGSIPGEIGSLTGLEVLNFESNQLSGSIPTEIGNLINLRYLYFDNNELTGSIPPEIGNLTLLYRLEISDNQLTGSIPAEIGDMTELQQLRIYNNQLSGSIPPEIGNLANLYRIYMYNNQLTGAVPSAITNLANLQQLYLYGNLLEDLPDLSPLTVLSNLYIADNKFTFEDIELNVGVPITTFSYSPQKSVGDEIDSTVVVGTAITLGVSVGGSDNIYQWNQDGTNIGSPSSSDNYTIDPVDFSHAGTYICAITSNIITDLTLYSNPINMDVKYPPQVEDSLALVALYNSTTNGSSWTDSTNWLTGPVSTWYGITLTSGRVTDIDLSSNNLVGTIPADIGELTSLTDMSLGDNQISGTIPSAIGDLTNLGYLHLSMNQLSGSIPLEIGNLASLTSLYLDNNQLTDSVPSTVGNLVSLENFEINHNQLVNLPDLTTLAALEYFYINDNSFTFEDIEMNLGVASVLFNYSPQDSVGTARTDTVLLNDSFTVAVTIGGANNQYQWYLDDAAITGATDSAYAVASCQAADYGIYTCDITNTLATDLTLFSRPVTIISDDSDPPVITPDAANPTSLDAGFSTQAYNATVTDYSGVNQVLFKYSNESTEPDSWSSVQMTYQGSDVYGVTINESEFGGSGIQYYIYADDLRGQADSTSILTTTLRYPGGESYTISKSRDSLSYKIIAIPFELDNPSVTAVFDELGPYDEEKWRLFKHVWGTTNYQEYNAFSNIARGEGYWFLNDSVTSINFGAGSAPSEASKTLSLKTGWNMIGNPYLFNLSWSYILEYNGNPAGVGGELNVFDRAYGRTNRLGKYEGAFVSVDNNIDIEIPMYKHPSENGRIARDIKFTPDYLENSLENDNWDVILKLESGSVKYNFGGIGMRADASDDFDQYDELTLPRFFGYLELNHHNIDLNGFAVTRNIVSTNLEHEWNFNIESSQKGKMTNITWDNSYFGIERYLTLYDLTNQVKVDMNNQDSYVFKADNNNPFKILFSTEKPEPGNNLMLQNAYPNPFSNEVILSLVLPESKLPYLIEIKIFNSIGQPVYKLTDNYYNSGVHELTWDGRNISGSESSNGLYIVHMQVNHNGTVSEFHKTIIKK